MMGGVFYAMTLSQPAIGLNFGNMTMTPGPMAWAVAVLLCLPSRQMHTLANSYNSNKTSELAGTYLH